ncbi:MAG: NusG domain II-containing protein [Gallionella sp.]|nr:NusG domain II-containing protein [Gallionella sp.]
MADSPPPDDETRFPLSNFPPQAGERANESLRDTLFNSSHLKAGDWLTLLLGGVCVVLLTLKLWSGDLADKAVIRSGGKIFREVPLSRDQHIEVLGPLGTSVIAIQQRKARIVSDPSPRQYCVRQGWLQQSGEIALCLPNQVSVELTGSQKKYDSLNY